MKKIVKISIWISIIIAFVNAAWLGYNTTQYLDIDQWFEKQEIYVMGIFIGLLVLFFSHLIIGLTIVLTLREKTSTFLSGIILLIIGSLSFIATFFHWGALTDILKEFPAGLEIINELKSVWLAHILHSSFIIYTLIYLFKTKRIKSSNNQSYSIIGEQLFVSMNIIGIVCGITGLLIVTIDFYFRVNPQSYKWVIIPYSLFIFIPYLITLSGWFFQAIKDKQSGWYDEKQRFDIYKSSTFTLLASIPLMFLLFLFNYESTNGIVSILWLPFYLFAILFIFSISSLYNFKSN